MDDADALHLRRPGDEGVEQDRRNCRGPVDVDLLAAADARDGFLGGNDAHCLPATLDDGADPWEDSRRGSRRWFGPGPRLDIRQPLGPLGECEVGPLELSP